MPTYEYRCSACNYEFERFQSITADPIKRCPECGKAKVKRLIGTGAGLIFKGSGFYITDYRDKSYTDKAKAESGGGGDGQKSGGETKTETTKGDTAAAKSDSKPADAGRTTLKGDVPAPTSSGGNDDDRPVAPTVVEAADDGMSWILVAAVGIAGLVVGSGATFMLVQRRG